MTPGETKRLLCKDVTLMETVKLDRELGFEDREKSKAWTQPAAH